MGLRFGKVVVSLLLLFGVPLLSQAAHPSVPPLQDAISSGEMTVHFEGDGGSSGDSIKARPAKGPKAGPGPVEAEIPPGSILRSGDPSAQSMMVVGVRGKDLGGGMIEPASGIVAGGGQSAIYILSAFCINFEKENPSSSTTFTLEQPDPVLACIAKRGKPLSVPALQAAVWMYTDHVSYASMSHKFPVSPQEWNGGQNIYQICQNPDSRTIGGSVQQKALGSAGGVDRGRSNGGSMTTSGSPAHLTPATSGGVYAMTSLSDSQAKQAQQFISQETKCINDPNIDAEIKRRCFDIRGENWGRIHNYDLAIDDFNDALKLQCARSVGFWCDDFNIFYHRAVAYEGKGDWDHAIADWKAIARHDPTSLNLLSLAGTYLEAGDFENALETDTSAISLYPNDPDPLTSRSDLYANVRKYDVAMRDCDAAISLQSTTAMRDGTWQDPRTCKVRIYRQMKRFDLALQEIGTLPPSTLMVNWKKAICQDAVAAKQHFSACEVPSK